jgi:hypothetical protein
MSKISAKFLLERLIAASFATPDSVVEMNYPTVERNVEGNLDGVIVRTDAETTYYVDQAYSHSTDFIRIGKNEEQGEIYADKLDKDVYDILLNAADVVLSRQTIAPPLTEVKLTRAVAPTVAHALLRVGVTKTQIATAAGLVFAGAVVVAVGISFAVTNLIAVPMIALIGEIPALILTICGMVAVQQFTSFHEWLAGNILGGANFVMSLLWSAKDQAPAHKRIQAAVTRTAQTVKAKVVSTWSKVKSFFTSKDDLASATPSAA